MNIDEFRRLATLLLPDCEVTTDNYGQIIIYTGKMIDFPTQAVVDFQETDPS